MALVKPLLSPIASFDATQSQTLHFIVNGGDQVVKNTIQILNNQTSAVIYEHTEHTFSYEQTIPANTLTNGTYYAVRFKTFDRNAKENIKYLSDKESEDFIYSLKPCTFKYKSGERQHHGFIAQEVKESMSNKDWGVYIDPKIKGDKAEYKALRYEEIIADLVKVVQSQNKRIEELEKKVGDK